MTCWTKTVTQYHTRSGLNTNLIPLSPPYKFVPFGTMFTSSTLIFVSGNRVQFVLAIYFSWDWHYASQLQTNPETYIRIFAKTGASNSKVGSFEATLHTECSDKNFIQESLQIWAEAGVCVHEATVWQTVMQARRCTPCRNWKNKHWCCFVCNSSLMNAHRGLVSCRNLIYSKSEGACHCSLFVHTWHTSLVCWMALYIGEMIP